MNSQIRSQSLSLALLVGALNTAPLTGGCTADDSSSSDAGDPASSAKKASDALWTTYCATTIPTLSTCNWPCSRRFGRTLDDAELTALLAATHWWHLSEAAARERHPDPAVLNSDLLTALQLMRQAAQLDPDEDHWPGFIGVLTVHIGPRTNDPNLVAQGDQILEEAVYLFPEFNGFNMRAAHNADPKDSLRRRGGWSEGSGLEGSRRCSRMARAVAEPRTTATTRRVPPQRGQVRTLDWKVRRRLSAQGMGRRGGRGR